MPPVKDDRTDGSRFDLSSSRHPDDVRKALLHWRRKRAYCNTTIVGICFFSYFLLGTLDLLIAGARGAVVLLIIAIAAIAAFAALLRYWARAESDFAVFQNCDLPPVLEMLIEEISQPVGKIRRTAVRLVAEHLDRCGLRVVRTLPPGSRNRLYALLLTPRKPLAPKIVTCLAEDPDLAALPWMRLFRSRRLGNGINPATAEIYAACERALISASAAVTQPDQLLRASAAPQNTRTLLTPARGRQRAESQTLMRAAGSDNNDPSQ